MTTAPSFVGSASGSGTSTSVAVPKPSGVIDGDTIYVVLRCTSGRTISAPDGTWSQVEAMSGTETSALFEHPASSEPASWTFSFSSNSAYSYISYAVRGAASPATDGHSSGSTSTSSTSVVMGPITNASANDRLVAIAMHAGSGTVSVTPDPAMTEREDVSGSEPMELADQVLTSSGSTGTRTATQTSSGYGWIMFGIKPAPPPPVTVTPSAASLAATPATPTVTATKNKTVTPSAASLTLTAATPVIGSPVRIAPAAATLATTRSTPVIGHSAKVTPTAATLATTTATPVIGHSGKVTPAAATLATTPATPSVVVNHIMAPAAASLATTRNTPTIGTSKHVAPSAASLSATPATPSIGIGYFLHPVAASLATTLATPVIGTSGLVAPVAATLTLTANTPTIGTSKKLTPAAASLIATLATPHIGPSRHVAPSAATLTITLSTPAIGTSRKVAPTATTLTITRNTPLIGTSAKVTPSAAALIASLAAAHIGPSQHLAPTAATLTLTLSTPSVGTSKHVTPSAASLAVTLSTMAIKLGGFVRPHAATLTLTPGQAVVIGYMPPIVSWASYGTQLSNALAGVYGPARYEYVFERRKADYTFIDDITPWVIQDSATIDLNNDRDVCRQLTIALDATRLYHGASLDLDTFSDHIVPRMRLYLPRRVIGWPAQVDVPLGLYQLTWPEKKVTEGNATWDITGGDLCIQLQQDGPSTVYTVGAGVDCITGANAVTAILTAQGLRYSMLASGNTTAAAKSYDPGTPWLTIINDLLTQANYYALTFDRTGIAQSKPISDLTTQPTNATYDASINLLSPWDEQGDLTRFANNIVVTVNDPSVAPMHSVATNSDPDNAVSTVSLGRTITKFITTGAVANQAALDARAFSELQQAAAFYRTADLLTLPDPLREPRELYLIELPDASDGEVWQVRNWNLPLVVGAQMKHTISRVQKLVAA